MITNTITEKQAEYISSLMSAKLAVAEIGDDAFVAQQRNAQNKSREWVRIIFSAMPASMDMSKEEASEVIEFLKGFPSDIRRLAFEIRRVKITESVARFAGERALAMMDALATSIETKSHRGRYEHLMTVQEIWAAILTDWIAENPETQPNPDNDPTPTASTATENTLDAVMTASEIAVEFDTSERNVRMAAERGAVKARQSGKTWLILRRDAERMWKRREFLNISDTKRVLAYSQYRVFDTSGPNSRGYEFSISRIERIDNTSVPVGDPLLVSFQVYRPDLRNAKGDFGAYEQVFKVSDILALIND